MNLATIKTNIATYVWPGKPGEPGSLRFHWHRFLQIMVMTGRDIASGMLSLRSMSLVYTTLLAFVPLLAVSLSVMKEMGVHDQLGPLLTGLLTPLGERSSEFSGRIIAFVENMKIGVLGVLGLSMLIYTIISLIHKIESAFNHTWRLQNRRSLIIRFSHYLSVVLVGPVLVFSAVAITASLGSNTILSAIIELPFIGAAISIFGKILPYMLIIGAFTFFYKLVPNTRVRLGSAFYGALVAGILWESTGLLFASFVVGSTNYAVIYSGFAIILMLMIWVYLSWMILLIGASITYYHQHPEHLRRRNSNIDLSTRIQEQLALQLMLDISRTQNQQPGFESSVDNLAYCHQLPVKILQRMLNILEAEDLITRTKGDPPQYLTARPIDKIYLIDILRGSRGTGSVESGDNYSCDQPVSNLLNNIESSYESVLGGFTLADLLAQKVRGNSDENSIV